MFDVEFGCLDCMVVFGEVVGFGIGASGGAVEGDRETQETRSCSCRHGCCWMGCLGALSLKEIEKSEIEALRLRKME